MSTKGDIINEAYSRARISGLTRNPTPSDIGLALKRLESMAALWEAMSVCTGYAFEDDPDPTTPHNVPRQYWNAYESNLAISLLSDFGKQPAQTLVMEAQGTFSAVSGATARVEQINEPNRMPVGSGNRLYRNRWSRYYPTTTQVDVDCDARLTVGDVDILTEHYDAWLRDGETVSTYTIASSESGLTVGSDSLTTPDITYTVTAVTAGTYTVTITATSSLGRIQKRKKVFVVSA